MRCGACQFENPAGFKFCGECGARLTTSPQTAPADGADPSPRPVPPSLRPPVPLEGLSTTLNDRLPVAIPSGLADKMVSSGSVPAGERRKVTILFADLKDNTRLADRLEVEEIYQILSDCLRGLAEVVFRHEGYVDKFMGDGIMALFGAPVAHGDDPQRALGAALEMQAWVGEYGRDAEARWGAPLRLRIGLNFGTVIAGRVGTDLKMEYDVIGDAVNVAKRMEEVAEPGTICVSDALFRLTERRFAFAPLGPLAIKGKEEPLPIYRLLGPRDEPRVGDEPAAGGPMVGRQRELAALRACFERARAGEAQFVRVSGEPGIGKTRLLEEWLRRIVEDATCPAVRIHSERCDERRAHTPYDLCRRLVQAAVSDGGEREGTPARSPRLSPRVSAEDEPFLRQLLCPETPRPELRWLDRQTGKQLTVGAVCRLLLRWTAETPTILLLDDLQWIDALSLEVLDALVDRLSEEAGPLLLVAAHRPEFAHAWPPAPAATHLSLDVLDRQACLELIASRLDPRSLPEAALSSLLDRSGGNPHYLEEVVRSLPERSEVPDSLYGAIMARLDRLGSEERSLLQAAAVIGGRFPARLAAELVPIRAGLEALLGRLEALEFVREVSPPPQEEYAFRHSAVRDVAYGALLLQQRRLYHRQVAQRLEALHAGRDAEHLEELARHFSMAEDGPRAVLYLLRAGDQARDLYANGDAIQFYERALGLLDRVEEDPAGTRAAHELAIRDGMADVRYRLGEYEAAWEEYGRARALAAGDPGAGVRVAGIVRRMAKCAAELGQHENALALQAEAEAALDSCEEAGEERLDAAGVCDGGVPAGPPTPSAGCPPAAETSGGARRRRRAPRRPERVAAPGAILERSRILLDGGWVQYAAGRYAETVRCAQQAQALAEPIGAAREMGDAFNLLGVVAKTTGNYAEAIQHYSRTLELARASEDVLGIGIALNNLGNVHCEQGRLVDAEACYDQAVQIWERMGDVVQKAQTLNNLGNIFLARGEFARAEERFRAAHHLFRRVNQPLGIAASLGTLGELYLEEGRLAEAARSLEEALSLVEATVAPEYDAYFHAVLAQIYMEQGQLDEAERCCCAVLQAADQPDQALSEVYEGRARRVRGLVLSARGRHRGAVAELERARQIFRAADQAQELGRTCIALASVRRELQEEAEAASLLRAAIALFEQAGARADLEKARAIASC